MFIVLSIRASAILHDKTVTNQELSSVHIVEIVAFRPNELILLLPRVSKVWGISFTGEM